MIKIVHVQLLPLLSGVQRVCLDELQRLDVNMFDRYLICSSPGPLTEEAEKLGVKCIYVKHLKREISLFHDTLAFYELIKIFRKYRFDIVHSHSSKTGVLSRLAAKICRIPLIVHTVHGYSFPAANTRLQYLIYYIMERLGGMCGNVMICLHHDDADIAINKLKINENKVLVVPNGVDIEKYHKINEPEIKSIKEQNNIPEGKLIIGMVGRLWPQKNPKLLLSSFLKISEKFENVLLVFVGSGELKDEMINFVDDHGLENKVLFLGWRHDTPILLNTFDIFVLPSLWEGMPLAILEAQACSLPCVVSDIPGNRHLVKDNIDGLLFSLGPVNTLTKSLELLLSNPEQRSQLGVAARRKVEKYYNIDKRVNKLERVYLSKLNH